MNTISYKRNKTAICFNKPQSRCTVLNRYIKDKPVPTKGSNVYNQGTSAPERHSVTKKTIRFSSF